VREKRKEVCLKQQLRGKKEKNFCWKAPQRGRPTLIATEAGGVAVQGLSEAEKEGSEQGAPGAGSSAKKEGHRLFARAKGGKLMPGKKRRALGQWAGGKGLSSKLFPNWADSGCTIFFEIFEGKMATICCP